MKVADRIEGKLDDMEAEKHQCNGHVPPLETVSTVPVGDEKPAQSGRTANGTFAAGNSFARGNPNARKTAALRSALLEAATVERMKALGEKLFEAAQGGDWTAAKLLLAYLVGKPGKAVDPDRLDLDEWLLLQEHPTKPEIVRALLEDMAPALAAEVVHRVRSGQPTDPGAVVTKLLEDGHGLGSARKISEEIEAKRRRRK
jgi:hypothetical protein